MVSSGSSARDVDAIPKNNEDTMNTGNIDTNTFKSGTRSSLRELRVRHRDLDATIDELVRHPHVDQLRVSRLKKQKLRLKDMISRLESQLIPDLNA